MRRHDKIVIETLNLEGMKRLWGRKISDLAFGEFALILQWTSAKYGKIFLKANRWEPTTKPCSNCGYQNENLTLSDRYWTCPECSTRHDRDVNAGHKHFAGWGARVLMHDKTALMQNNSLRVER